MPEASPYRQVEPAYCRQKCRELNDQLRRHFTGGQIVITQGVRALGEPRLIEVLAAIRQYDGFDTASDPYGEHDFGEVNVGSKRVWFKLDYLDLDREYGSPDPSDPDLTTRVMTILLPEGY